MCMCMCIHCTVPAPVLEFISCDDVVLVGSTVTLNCTGSSLDGNVNVTWSTDLGVTLPPATLTREDDMTVTSRLVLDSVEDANGGVYMCTVSNRVNQIVDTVQLSVISECPITLIDAHHHSVPILVLPPCPCLVVIPVCILMPTTTLSLFVLMLCSY